MLLGANLYILVSTVANPITLSAQAIKHAPSSIWVIRITKCFDDITLKLKPYMLISDIKKKVQLGEKAKDL